jgi:protoporphyrinogen oxidase
MSSRGSIIVVGGGLAGLSTLWHLQRAGCDNCHLFEKESRVGGLIRSEVVNGFTFDYTGHLLHFKNTGIQQLVSRLLGDNLHYVARNSWVFSKGVFTRYPFQTNLHGLPPEVIKECILGFVSALQSGTTGEGESSHEAMRKMSFAEWIEVTLGTGIARHFMTPYNEKLWTVPLDELTCDWMGRFVPTTSLEQILDGALVDASNNIGYNATFGYPLRGGIESLARAFAATLTNIHTAQELTWLDLEKKQVGFKTGETLSYDRLVATMPLPTLLRATISIPDKVRQAAEKLRFTSVYNVNFGVNRNLSNKHWIYFPESDYCFHRVGFCHNFSPQQAPAGCGSVYAEVAYSAWKPLDKSAVVGRVRADLQKAGILREKDQILAECCFNIPCAYVIYDKNHRASVELLRSFMRKNDVYTIGRYGAWEYSGMEDAIWQGQLAAEEMVGE